MPATMQDQAYRIYRRFLETAENKRHWNIFKDVPWNKLDISKATSAPVQSSRSIVPKSCICLDYSSKGIEMNRSVFGMAWFQIRWAFEEDRHGLAFREYLTRSRLRWEAQMEDLERATFSREWQMLFETSRQMACYGAIQEGATFTAYNSQRKKALCGR